MWQLQNCHMLQHPAFAVESLILYTRKVSTFREKDPALLFAENTWQVQWSCFIQSSLRVRMNCAWWGKTFQWWRTGHSKNTPNGSRVPPCMASCAHWVWACHRSIRLAADSDK